MSHRKYLRISKSSVETIILRNGGWSSLTDSNRNLVEFVSDRSFMGKSTPIALALLERLVENSQQ